VKTALRQQVRERMAGIAPAELQQRGRAIVDRFLAQPEFDQAGTIMMYLSIPPEVDTAAIAIRAWEEGKRVLAPLVDWEQKRMIPVEIGSLSDDVRTDRHGVRVPVDGVPIPIGDIDLVVVPGIAFDGQGNRLGRGGGYYDRFLSHRDYRASSCALAFDEQVVDSVPHDDRDMRVSLLISDTRLLRFSNASGAR